MHEFPFVYEVPFVCMVMTVFLLVYICPEFVGLGQCSFCRQPHVLVEAAASLRPDYTAEAPDEHCACQWQARRIAVCWGDSKD